MPRKKEFIEEGLTQPAEVLQPVSTELPEGKRNNLVDQVRRFPLQFLCGGLATALIVVTMLYLGERNSNQGVHQGTPDMMTGELDTTNDQAVLQAVSRLMVLPAESDPIIALVADAARLQTEQAFYRGAENGDILLVFPQSRQAIIYRPSSNQIVNVGPLIVDDNE